MAGLRHLLAAITCTFMIWMEWARARWRAPISRSDGQKAFHIFNNSLFLHFIVAVCKSTTCVCKELTVSERTCHQSSGGNEHVQSKVCHNMQSNTHTHTLSPNALEHLAAVLASGSVQYWILKKHCGYME